MQSFFCDKSHKSLGNGLGLTLVKDIVDLSKGKIEVKTIVTISDTHGNYSGVEKLPNESKEDYEIRVLNDIQLSKDLIEQHLNTDVYFFAHPYGKTEPWSNDYLQSEFKVTVTSEEGVADISDGFYNLPRYNISTSNPPSKYLVD